MRILTFSTLFPNREMPRHGIFVAERLRHLLASGSMEATVVAPIPWFPFTSKRFGAYGTFARVPNEEEFEGCAVLHPRYPVIPKVGMSLAPVLLATARSMLDVSASVLKRHPDQQVEIVGFADSRGPESYNMKLSERRADAVRQYLENAGVDSSRLTSRGYGEGHEGASDMSANGLAQSRRVELRVTSR